MAVQRERIEALWSRGEVETLARELAHRRSEWSAHAVDRAQATPCAAALALLTLEELGVSPQDALLQELTQALEASQDGSGAWENPWTTALVLRALAVTGRAPASTARGLAYLASTQTPTGCWIAGNGADFHDTAFVLTMLGDLDDFRHAVDVERALHWCAEREVAPSRDRSPLLESAERQWSIALQRVPPGAASLN